MLHAETHGVVRVNRFHEPPRFAISFAQVLVEKPPVVRDAFAPWAGLDEPLNRRNGESLQIRQCEFVTVRRVVAPRLLHVPTLADVLAHPPRPFDPVGLLLLSMVAMTRLPRQIV